MSKAKWLLIASATLSIALASVVSAATDRKTLPGIACQPLNQSAAITRSSTTSRMFNNSDGTQTWVCPVVRDFPKKSINAGSVFVVDNHFNVNVRCRLHARDEFTSSGFVSAWKYSSGTNPNAQKLTFGSLSHYNLGAAHYQCEVPGKYSGVKSGIQVYEVSENT